MAKRQLGSTLAANDLNIVFTRLCHSNAFGVKATFEKEKSLGSLECVLVANWWVIMKSWSSNRSIYLKYNPIVSNKSQKLFFQASSDAGSEFSFRSCLAPPLPPMAPTPKLRRVGSSTLSLNRTKKKLLTVRPHFFVYCKMQNQLSCSRVQTQSVYYFCTDCFAVNGSNYNISFQQMVQLLWKPFTRWSAVFLFTFILALMSEIERTRHLLRNDSWSW